MDVNKWLNDRIIFECISGSRAYGVHTSDSDYDYRGCAIPPADYFIGLYKFEQSVQTHPDRTIFGIIKLIKLMVDNNPNCIELLFVPDDAIIKTSASWDRIRAHKEVFLSKKCKFTYAGYAYSQLKRVKTHRGWLLNPPKEQPTRAAYGLPDYEKLPKELMGAISTVIKDALQDELTERFQIAAVDAAELFGAIKDVMKDDIASAVEDALIEHIIPVIIKNIEPTEIMVELGERHFSSEIMALYEKERAYKNALIHWNQYQTWVKNRNPKRAELERQFGYDTKHMSHVDRLLTQGEEILAKGTLTVKLAPEHAERCRGIRAGAFSYEELMDSAEKKIAIFDELYKTSTVRHSVDVNAVNSMVMGVIDDFLFAKKDWK